MPSDRSGQDNLQARIADLEKQLQRLQLVHDVNIELTSTLDLERVLLKALERVKNAVGSATASILILEGDVLVFTYSIGDKAEQIKPFRVPLGVGISGIVGQTRQAAYTNDVQNDGRFYRTVDSGTGYTTHSLMAAPLVVNDRLIGVITATNKEGGFADGDLDLIGTIGAASGIAIENARLYRVAVEKGRIERELQMARDVQMSLIPKETPQVAGWQFAGLWKPAREVSGDLYDFVRLDENRLAVVVADVSDKGMPAALFMSLVRSALRASAVPDLTPAQSVMQANRVIAADAHGGMFVTVFFAVIDFANQRMTYVNGGHPPPLVFRATSNDFVELTRTGIALGIFGSALYTEQVVEIQPEDWVVMYTDGVTDAASPRGEAFGEERLRRILEAHTHSGASTIVDSMDLALHEFIDDAAPFDDITILAAKHGN